MVQSSQMNIPYNSATTFFTAPYNQELANHGVTKEEYQNTLFRISHKKQHSGSSTATNCCNIFNFSMSFCCCVLCSFLLAFIFLIATGAPGVSKSSIKSALISKKDHTIALGGDPIAKFKYLARLAEEERFSFVGMNTVPTQSDVDSAFAKQEVIYMNMDALYNSQSIKNYVCQKLSTRREVKFFGGYHTRGTMISWLMKCRSEKHIKIISYVEPMTFRGSVSIMFFFGLIFACVLGTPFCCCFAFKYCNRNSATTMSQILYEETSKYHQRGVQFIYNDITKSIDVFFYNGPVPQYQPQVQVVQQQFIPQQPQQQQQQQFIPQQPQYREVHHQQPRVQVQPQFNVQPSFTSSQQSRTEEVVQQSNDTENVYQNVYYSSNVDEVPEESQTQAFLYPKQNGIINEDRFE